MGLMTTLAISCGHVAAVRLVALGTKRNFAMGAVAEAACQSGMLAFDLLQLDNLLGMAGEALIGDIVGKFDDFRGMRIVVTAQTGGKVIMRFAAVTLAADRDDFFNRRRMTGVTINAADRGFVSTAIGFNSCRRC